mmetsp:Transcript_4556/g.6926  ORF Transcript_4556/g.6926 Transcript_4556/m.6926 type:complete len:138 (+) Transcript_4556:168-581(+)|eukprot:CAMPEP_0197247528 /NCGR_PEP_ID=MMETSP1429-20130617/29249_1 /TAXON_ID=49237 /ORGANISM="Chaetoceros  sp., Strain UNC1202" /LENGTH=137 /DNA_ID=CAMNT_0042708447 /DNA_START=104 /DNA_END=517 /DNA_ORIENTATION=-
MKLLIQLCTILPCVAAFSAPSTCATTRSNTALDAETPSRRAFLSNAVAFGAAAAVSVLPAFAEDVDDLAMPSEAEDKINTAAEMEERIRKKRELQKKATKPATFKESFSKEQDKQKDLQKSKEERRAALCEELGRGC